ncbi:MAG TPA: hypothetical protein VK348_11420, partial [Planctomycetota bacterium]|nr:hypothetical protein [Planctomycetota bacterium]
MGSWHRTAVGTFPFAAFALWTLGAGPVDAVLLSVPLLLPWWCGALPPRQRQRLLRLELPVLAAFAAAVGVAMAASNARLVGASVPWRSGFVFGGYVLLWVVALRLARDGLRHLAMRWLLRRPKLADVLATLLTVGLGFPQLYVGLQTHRIAMPQRPDPHLDGVQIEEVAFATSDAVPLRGTLLRQRGTAPVVVVCHGVGANRAVFFPLAEIAAGLGCHALA